jgi:hypothetical protein
MVAAPAAGVRVERRELIEEAGRPATQSGLAFPADQFGVAFGHRLRLHRHMLSLSRFKAA